VPVLELVLVLELELELERAPVLASLLDGYPASSGRPGRTCYR
jgi:hypothetical protein